MKRLCVALALACGAAFSSYAAETAPVPTADIAKRGLTAQDFPRTKQLAPDVYVYEDLLTADGTGFTTNSLIVVTSGGVVVADGQANVKLTQALIDTVAKITPQPIRYVVIASDHGDHAGGNAAFAAANPDVVFIASPASQKVLARNAALPPVAETVADKRMLTVGGTEIEILNLGRGHTGGDLTVYLPRSKVLFLGELYLHHLFPSMVTGYPSEWAAALKKAQDMDAAWYVPGHGFTDDATAMKAGLGQARAVIERIIAEAKRLRAAGHPCESQKDCPAAAHAQWGAYAGLTAYEPQHARALARAYMELDGKLPD